MPRFFNYVRYYQSLRQRTEESMSLISYNQRYKMKTEEEFILQYGHHYFDRGAGINDSMLSLFKDRVFPKEGDTVLGYHVEPWMIKPINERRR